MKQPHSYPKHKKAPHLCEANIIYVLIVYFFEAM